MPSSARLTEAASEKSPTTSSSAFPSTPAARAGSRTNARTGRPRRCNSRTTREPIVPVAPATSVRVIAVLSCARGGLAARHDVGVLTEEVCGIAAVLERGQPREPLSVGCPDARSILVGKEVRIDPDAVGTQGLPALANPRPVALATRIGRRPPRDDVELEADFALPDRRRITAGAAHRAANGPSTDLRERRRDALDPAHDHLDDLVGQLGEPMRLPVVV